MRCLGVVEAVERLAGPEPAEIWSGLADLPYLAIDVRPGGPSPSAGASAAAIAAIASLPCPVIALGPPAPSVSPAFVAACDAVAAGQDELGAMIAGIARSPQASATLVQVLRATATLDIAAGLALESLAYATLQAGAEHARWRAARQTRAVPPDLAPTVALTRTEKELVLTLNRPERHNAFSARMRDQLADALAVAVVEPGLTVVLRGAGPSFCSGGDLDEFGSLPDPATAHLIRTTRSPARVLAVLGDRTRAELHGACIGAGIELAAFARTVTARPDTFVQLPEIAMGLIPGAGGTVSLPRRIGRQRTALLALGGRRLDAVTAHAWGLVDAVPAAEVS